MTISVTSETDTVIKKVLPYLQRRGYDTNTDLDFEAPALRQERQGKGYVDLLVTMGKKAPSFLVEAKRAGKKLTTKDRDQALSYGKYHKVLFVVVTNGEEILCYNVESGLPIKWNGSSYQKVPSSEQLKDVLKYLKTNKSATDVPLGTDYSQPYRPGLNPKQLNALFSKCHSDIRRIEKTEDRAFQDFSKLLFLKLYEEKCDVEGIDLPYSWTFADLAEKKDNQADQVREAISSMVAKLVKDKGYGEVLGDAISLKNDRTYQVIVRRLAGVSFYDSSFDSKGAAFEYYVRATLKGKKLGQYFTPRPVIRLMSEMVGREKIANSVLAGDPARVLDPACGTGGFLVYLMKANISRFEKMLSEGAVTKAQFAKSINLLKCHTFFGADANESVASAAKMNMIIAGDGQSNIHPEDTLSKASASWSVDSPNCDIIMTNPPFGTSEADSLSAVDVQQFPIRTKKGQLLFLQKMVLCAKTDGGEICTVIDEGVLNTDGAAELRKWILRHCQIVAVASLPDVTFKPNKINVKSSVLLLRRRKDEDVDLEIKYNIKFIEVETLGYVGSGDAIRAFDEEALMSQIGQWVNGKAHVGNGDGWRGFEVGSLEVAADPRCRLDLKYWRSETRAAIATLAAAGAKTLGDLATEAIRRGKSPAAETYVDESDGYALVLKSGTNISKFGEVLRQGDFIEKNQFEELTGQALSSGDILLSSTGTGTLGKCAVYRDSKPAIADGHVTVIRVDASTVYPEYVCDYLRLGFGASQIDRLFTGSTGLIELTPDQVSSILIETPGNADEQRRVSNEWRSIEGKFRKAISNAEHEFEVSRAKFLTIAPIAPNLSAKADDEEELTED